MPDTPGQEGAEGHAAGANVMDEYQFKALKRSQEIKELEPSRDTLKTLQSDLPVKGKFTTTLRNIEKY